MSQPIVLWQSAAGDVSHEPGVMLPLLSERPAAVQHHCTILYHYYYITIRYYIQYSVLLLSDRGTCVRTICSESIY